MLCEPVMNFNVSFCACCILPMFDSLVFVLQTGAALSWAGSGVNNVTDDFCAISAGTGSVLIWCRPEGICCDAAFRMMVCRIFSPFGSLLESVFCSVCPLYPYDIQFSFFKLELVRWV